MEPRFKKRINLVSTADFTRTEFTNINYFGQQCSQAMIQNFIQEIERPWTRHRWIPGPSPSRRQRHCAIL